MCSCMSRAFSLLLNLNLTVSISIESQPDPAWWVANDRLHSTPPPSIFLCSPITFLLFPRSLACFRLRKRPRDSYRSGERINSGRIELEAKGRMMKMLMVIEIVIIAAQLVS